MVSAPQSDGLQDDSLAVKRTEERENSLLTQWNRLARLEGFEPRSAFAGLAECLDIEVSSAIVDSVSCT